MRHDDPSNMSPDQRRRTLVSVFAAGVLRLRQRQLLSVITSKKPRKTAAKSTDRRLEVPGETVLSVPTGLRFRESENQGSTAC
jgi:hypothetical protein